jgi:ergothioneine biosynthesis protein EgtB
MAAQSSDAIQTRAIAGDSLITRFNHVRSTTLAICEPLEVEDYIVQSMPDASPLKWHLAHTTWFFEQFILRPRLADYRVFDAKYEYLFNSYYQSVGPMHRRAERGMLTRPRVEEIKRYREHVDAEMRRLLVAQRSDKSLADIVTLGLNHEQQHQELMFTDLKHLFSLNPLLPKYRDAKASAKHASTPSSFVPFEGGIRSVGASAKGFHFDNEGPRHRVLLEPFELADRLVTNAEFLDFIRDRGYERPEFWLSDGWATVQQQCWRHPLYWNDECDGEFTLHGFVALEPDAPVCHVSFYEADAYARWAGARLPTEYEWEIGATAVPVKGNLLGADRLHSSPATTASDQLRMRQMYGDVWEWTTSAYAAYPGYRAPAGALGEYNGKFMCNQLVLRGGSCVTPDDHIRASYRNFFYPQARWQFMGLRLARDAR